MQKENKENITKPIDRLLIYADIEGLSMNQMSKEIGVSNSYFSKMVRNHADIGSKILENIVRTYPNISLEWLLLGEGEILKTNSTSNVIDSNNNINYNKNYNKPKVQKTLPIEYDQPNEKQNIMNERKGTYKEGACSHCQEKNEVIEALKRTIEAMQTSLEDKERIIQLLAAKSEPLNKQQQAG